MTTIALVNAGMSEDSSTARLGHAVEDALRAAAARRGTAIDVWWIDLRPMARALADTLTTGFATGAVADAHRLLDAADAVVALTPVYQASYSGLFKTFVDVLPDDVLRGTPVLLGATGGSPRHAMVTEVAMRPLFIHLHADPVPTAVYAATEDWGAPALDSDGGEGARLEARVRRAATELLDRVAVRRGPTQAAGLPVGPTGVDETREAREAGATDEAREADGAPQADGTTAAASADPTGARPTCPDLVDFETLLARAGQR